MATKAKITVVVMILMVSISGCGPQARKPLKLCPGKATAEQIGAGDVGANAPI